MALARIRPEQRERVNRIIHFYDIEYTQHRDYPEGAEQGPWMNTIRKIIQMARELDINRYMRTSDRRVFIQDLTVHPGVNEITGKIISVNTEIFPEIQNLSTDVKRGIEALEDEGVVETSHFIIRYDDQLRIGLEYNHGGAKIVDFCNYIQRVGLNNEYLASVRFVPIVNHDIGAMVETINRVSELKLKIHRNNVEVLRNIDEGVFEAADIASRQFRNEYVTLAWKIKYRNLPATPEAVGFLTSLKNAFVRNPQLMESFEIVDVKAENREVDNKLQEYDLLLDKVKVKVSVDKRPKHRTIVSEHMFARIRESIRSLNI